MKKLLTLLLLLAATSAFCQTGIRLRVQGGTLQYSASGDNTFRPVSGSGVTTAQAQSLSFAEAIRLGNVGVPLDGRYLRFQPGVGVTLSDSLLASLQSGLSAAATPVFAPAGGTYTSTQSVTLTTATTGANIYYTTNGATPTTGSTLYSGPVSVSATTTLKAIAVKSGFANSPANSATYSLTTAAEEALSFVNPTGYSGLFVGSGEVFNDGTAPPNSFAVATKHLTGSGGGYVQFTFPANGNTDKIFLSLSDSPSTTAINNLIVLGNDGGLVIYSGPVNNGYGSVVAGDILRLTPSGNNVVATRIRSGENPLVLATVPGVLSGIGNVYVKFLFGQTPGSAVDVLGLKIANGIAN